VDRVRGKDQRRQQGADGERTGPVPGIGNEPQDQHEDRERHRHVQQQVDGMEDARCRPERRVRRRVDHVHERPIVV